LTQLEPNGAGPSTKHKTLKLVDIQSSSTLLKRKAPISIDKYSLVRPISNDAVPIKEKKLGK
jgi:hypothetical protein